MKSRHKKRISLFKKFKNCFHCNVEMVLTSDNCNDERLAVLENKYSTWESIRHRDEKGRRWRLVCQKCRRENEKEEIKVVPIEILRNQAKAYPLVHPKCTPRLSCPVEYPNMKKDERI